MKDADYKRIARVILKDLSHLNDDIAINLVDQVNQLRITSGAMNLVFYYVSKERITFECNGVQILDRVNPIDVVKYIDTYYTDLEVMQFMDWYKI